MKSSNIFQRLFRRPQPPPKDEAEKVEADKEPVDDRPEWRRRIDSINALCEARKRENQMLQGGRIVEVDETNKREA